MVETFRRIRLAAQKGLIVDREKLIELVRKLFVLGDKDRNSCEAEAQTAFAKAQSILRKYNIDMAEVVIKDGEKVVDIQVNDEIVFDIKRNSLGRWMKDLMSIVGKATNCKPFFNRKFEYPRTVYFQVGYVGTEVDRSIAKELYCYLYYTNIKLSRRFFPGSCSDQHWFLEGFCSKLWERIREELEEDKKEQVIHKTYALMVINKDAMIEQHMGKMGLQKGRSRRTNYDDFNDYAYGKGQREAEKVDIGTKRRLGENGGTTNYERE